MRHRIPEHRDDFLYRRSDDVAQARPPQRVIVDVTIIHGHRPAKTVQLAQPGIAATGRCQCDTSATRRSCYRSSDPRLRDSASRRRIAHDAFAGTAAVGRALKSAGWCRSLERPHDVLVRDAARVRRCIEDRVRSTTLAKADPCVRDLFAERGLGGHASIDRRRGAMSLLWIPPRSRPGD